MKGFDPHLIKWIIFGLVFVVRAVSSVNRKRKRANDTLRPPQSASAPPPIASPTMNQSQPMSRNVPNPPKGKGSNDGSPWSSNKGPFD